MSNKKLDTNNKCKKDKAKQQNNKNKKDKNKNDENKKKIKSTSRKEVMHKIRENANISVIKCLLNNIKDIKILISYNDSRRTLLFDIVSCNKIKISIFAYCLRQMIIEINNKNQQKPNRHKICDILNRGMKSSIKSDDNIMFDTTPFCKLLTTQRRTKLNESEIIKFEHMLLLLIDNGINVDCKSVIEPSKNSKKATDRQIVIPIQIAYRLKNPQIFLAIMFKSNLFNEPGNYEQNVIHYIIYIIKQLWCNNLNINIIQLECTDCSLSKFAEALRYYVIPRTINKIRDLSVKDIKKIHNKSIVTHKHMIKCTNIIRNTNDEEKVDVTALDLVNCYFPAPNITNVKELCLEITYNPMNDTLKKYKVLRDGLQRFIIVIPELFNLTQLHINIPFKVSNKNNDNIIDEKHCNDLLRSVQLHSVKYGTLYDIKFEGFKISSKSINRLTESIIHWKISGILYKELQQLALINVKLNNECIVQLFDAMDINKALRINKIILNKNEFDIVGMQRICKYVIDNNCNYLQHLEILKCNKLDFVRSDYPIFIILTVMSCIKKFALYLLEIDTPKPQQHVEEKNCNSFEDEKDDQKDDQKDSTCMGSNYVNICTKIIDEYSKYFDDKQYITNDLFPPIQQKLSSFANLASLKSVKSLKSYKRQRPKSAISNRRTFSFDQNTINTISKTQKPKGRIRSISSTNNVKIMKSNKAKKKNKLKIPSLSLLPINDETTTQITPISMKSSLKSKKLRKKSKLKRAKSTTSAQSDRVFAFNDSALNKKIKSKKISKTPVCKINNSKKLKKKSKSECINDEKESVTILERIYKKSSDIPRSLTAKKDIWNESINNIIKICDKMSVRDGLEHNMELKRKTKARELNIIEEKTMNEVDIISAKKRSIIYQIPKIDLKTESKIIYFTKPQTEKTKTNSTKRVKIGNHSHDKKKFKETNNWLKYNAKYKYLHIKLETINDIQIEFNRIKYTKLNYCFIELSSKRNITLTVKNVINIDYMLCIKNAKQIYFDSNCKLNTTQLWLNNNKNICIQKGCEINTVSSWYYQTNKIENKGQLKHTTHCFINNVNESTKDSSFKNEGDMIINGYFYCNLIHFDNIKTIKTNVIHHIECEVYNDNINSKTEIFGIGYYNINNICTVNGDIHAEVMLFNVNKQLNMNAKSLLAQQYCFIKCANKLVFCGNCHIKIGRNEKQLNQIQFKQKNGNIYGYNYTQLMSSNNAAQKQAFTEPILYIEADILIANGKIIQDFEIDHKYNKSIIAINANICNMNDIKLISRNKLYCYGNKWRLMNTKYFVNHLNVENIDQIQWNQNTTIQIGMSVNWTGNTLQMKQNSKFILLSNMDSDTKCNINLQKSFEMHPSSQIQCNWTYFRLNSNNTIQLMGKMITEGCYLNIFAEKRLIIEQRGKVYSWNKYPKEKHITFLKDKFDEKQLNIKNDLKQLTDTNNYYTRIASNGLIQIKGVLSGQNSLFIVDCNKEIKYILGSKIYVGGIYSRCVGNILSEGIIHNQEGNCYLRANKKLHLQSRGYCKVLNAEFHAPTLIIDSEGLFADNMSMEGTLKGDKVIIRKHETWDLAIIKCNKLEIYGTLDTKDEDLMLHVNELKVHSKGSIKAKNIILKPYNLAKNKIITVYGNVICTKQIQSQGINIWNIRESGIIECGNMNTATIQWLQYGKVIVNNSMQIVCNNKFVLGFMSYLVLNNKNCGGNIEAPAIEIFGQIITSNKTNKVELNSSDYVLRCNWEQKLFRYDSYLNDQKNNKLFIVSPVLYEIYHNDIDDISMRQSCNTKFIRTLFRFCINIRGVVMLNINDNIYAEQKQNNCEYENEMNALLNHNYLWNPILEYISTRYTKPGMYDLNILCQWQSIFQNVVRNLNSYKNSKKLLQPPPSIRETVTHAVSQAASNVFSFIVNRFKRTAKCDITAENADINNSITTSDLNATINNNLNMTTKSAITAKDANMAVGNAFTQKGGLTITNSGNLDLKEHDIIGNKGKLDLNNTNYNAENVSMSKGASAKLENCNANATNLTVDDSKIEMKNSKMTINDNLNMNSGRLDADGSTIKSNNNMSVGENAIVNAKDSNVSVQNTLNQRGTVNLESCDIDVGNHIQSGVKSLLILNLSNYNARGNVTMSGGARGAVFGGTYKAGDFTMNGDSTNMTMTNTDIDIANNFTLNGGTFGASGQNNSLNIGDTFAQRGGAMNLDRVNMNVAGDFNQSAGDFEILNASLNVSGNGSIGGNFTARDTDIDFANNLDISGNVKAFGQNNKFNVGNNLNANNGSNVFLQNMNASVGNDLNVNAGDFEMDGGSLDAKNANIKNGSTFTTDGTNVTIEKDFNSHNSKINAIKGEYIINGDMNAIDADISFTEVSTKVGGRLKVSGGSMKTFGGELTVDKDVDIDNNGLLKTTATNVHFKKKLNVRSGIFGARGGELTVDDDVNANNGGTVQLEQLEAKFNANLNVDTGGTVDVKNATLNVKNDSNIDGTMKLKDAHLRTKNATFNGQLDTKGISSVHAANDIKVDGIVNVNNVKGKGALQMKAGNNFIASANSTINAENSVVDIHSVRGKLDMRATGTVKDLRMKSDNMQNVMGHLQGNTGMNVTESLTLDIGKKSLDINQSISRSCSVNLIAASLNVNASIYSARSIGLKTTKGSVCINQTKIDGRDVQIESAKDVIATASHVRGRNKLFMKAKGDILNQCTEHDAGGGRKYWNKGKFEGGSGGMTLIATTGSIIFDNSDAFATGEIAMQAKKEMKFLARVNSYCAEKWSKKKQINCGFFKVTYGETKYERWEQQKSTCMIKGGKVKLKCDGNLIAEGADFIASQNDFIADIGGSAFFYDVVTTTTTYSSDSSWFGLSKKESFNQSQSTKGTMLKAKGTTYVKAKFDIKGISASFYGANVFLEAENGNIDLRKRKLQNKSWTKKRGFTFSGEGDETGGSCTLSYSWSKDEKEWESLGGGGIYGNNVSLKAKNKIALTDSYSVEAGNLKIKAKSFLQKAAQLKFKETHQKDTVSISAHCNVDKKTGKAKIGEIGVGYQHERSNMQGTMVADAYLSANNIDWDVDDATFHGADCIAQTQSGRVDNLDVVAMQNEISGTIMSAGFSVTLDAKNKFLPSEASVNASYGRYDSKKTKRVQFTAGAGSTLKVGRGNFKSADVSENNIDIKSVTKSEFKDYNKSISFGFAASWSKDGGPKLDNLSIQTQGYGALDHISKGITMGHGLYKAHQAKKQSNNGIDNKRKYNGKHKWKFDYNSEDNKFKSQGITDTMMKKVGGTILKNMKIDKDGFGLNVPNIPGFKVKLSEKKGFEMEGPGGLKAGFGTDGSATVGLDQIGTLTRSADGAVSGAVEIDGFGTFGMSSNGIEYQNDDIGGFKIGSNGAEINTKYGVKFNVNNNGAVGAQYANDNVSFGVDSAGNAKVNIKHEDSELSLDTQKGANIKSHGITAGIGDGSFEAGFEHENASFNIDSKGSFDGHIQNDDLKLDFNDKGMIIETDINGENTQLSAGTGGIGFKNEEHHYNASKSGVHIENKNVLMDLNDGNVVLDTNIKGTEINVNNDNVSLANDNVSVKYSNQNGLTTKTKDFETTITKNAAEFKDKNMHFKESESEFVAELKGTKITANNNNVTVQNDSMKAEYSKEQGFKAETHEYTVAANKDSISVSGEHFDAALSQTKGFDSRINDTQINVTSKQASITKGDNSAIVSKDGMKMNINGTETFIGPHCIEYKDENGHYKLSKSKVLLDTNINDTQIKVNNDNVSLLNSNVNINYSNHTGLTTNTKDFVANISKNGAEFKDKNVHLKVSENEFSAKHKDIVDVNMTHSKISGHVEVKGTKMTSNSNEVTLKNDSVEAKYSKQKGFEAETAQYSFAANKNAISATGNNFDAKLSKTEGFNGAINKTKINVDSQQASISQGNNGAVISKDGLKTNINGTEAFIGPNCVEYKDDKNSHFKLSEENGLETKFKDTQFNINTQRVSLENNDSNALISKDDINVNIQGNKLMVNKNKVEYNDMDGKYLKASKNEFRTNLVTWKDLKKLKVNKLAEGFDINTNIRLPTVKVRLPPLMNITDVFAETAKKAAFLKRLPDLLFVTMNSDFIQQRITLPLITANNIPIIIAQLLHVTFTADYEYMISVDQMEVIQLLKSTFVSNIIPFELIQAVTLNNSSYVNAFIDQFITNHIGPNYAANTWNVFQLNHVSNTINSITDDENNESLIEINDIINRVNAIGTIDEKINIWNCIKMKSKPGKELTQKIANYIQKRFNLPYYWFNRHTNTTLCFPYCEELTQYFGIKLPISLFTDVDIPLPKALLQLLPFLPPKLKASIDFVTNKWRQADGTSTIINTIQLLCHSIMIHFNISDINIKRALKQIGFMQFGNKQISLSFKQKGSIIKALIMSKYKGKDTTNEEMYWDTLMSIIYNKKMNINQMHYLCQQLGYFKDDNSILDEMLKFKFIKQNDTEKLNKLIIKNMKCLSELDEKWINVISTFNKDTKPKEMVHKLLQLVFEDHKYLESIPSIWKQFYYDDDQKYNDKSPIMDKQLFKAILPRRFGGALVSVIREIVKKNTDPQIVFAQILSELSIPSSIIELLTNNGSTADFDMKQMVSLIVKEYYCVENKCLSEDLLELVMSSLNGSEIDREQLCHVLCQNMPLPLKRIVNNKLLSSPTPNNIITNNINKMPNIYRPSFCNGCYGSYTIGYEVKEQMSTNDMLEIKQDNEMRNSTSIDNDGMMSWLSSKASSVANKIGNFVARNENSSNKPKTNKSEIEYRNTTTETPQSNIMDDAVLLSHSLPGYLPNLMVLFARLITKEINMKESKILTKQLTAKWLQIKLNQKQEINYKQIEKYIYNIFVQCGEEAKLIKQYFNSQFKIKATNSKQSNLDDLWIDHTSNVANCRELLKVFPETLWKGVDNNLLSINRTLINTSNINNNLKIYLSQSLTDTMTNNNMYLNCIAFMGYLLKHHNIKSNALDQFLLIRLVLNRQLNDGITEQHKKNKSKPKTKPNNKKSKTTIKSKRANDYRYFPSASSGIYGVYTVNHNHKTNDNANKPLKGTNDKTFKLSAKNGTIKLNDSEKYQLLHNVIDEIENELQKQILKMNWQKEYITNIAKTQVKKSLHNPVIWMKFLNILLKHHHISANGSHALTSILYQSTLSSFDTLYIILNNKIALYMGQKGKNTTTTDTKLAELFLKCSPEKSFTFKNIYKIIIKNMSEKMWSKHLKSLLLSNENLIIPTNKYEFLKYVPDKYKRDQNVKTILMDILAIFYNKNNENMKTKSFNKLIDDLCDCLANLSTCKSNKTQIKLIKTKQSKYFQQNISCSFINWISDYCSFIQNRNNNIKNKELTKIANLLDIFKDTFINSLRFDQGNDEFTTLNKLLNLQSKITPELAVSFAEYLLNKNKCELFLPNLCIQMLYTLNIFDEGIYELMIRCKDNTLCWKKLLSDLSKSEEIPKKMQNEINMIINHSLNTKSEIKTFIFNQIIEKYYKNILKNTCIYNQLKTFLMRDRPNVVIIHEICVDLLKHLKNDGLFDFDSSVYCLVDSIINIDRINNGSRKNLIIEKIFEYLKLGPFVVTIVKNLINDKNITDKMVNKWIEELLVGLCNICDGKSENNNNFSLLAQALINIDTKKDENGIDLFCYLLNERGLPLSLTSLLQQRLKDGKYKNKNNKWLKCFVHEMDKSMINSNTSENKQLMYFGVKSYYYITYNNPIHIIMELIDNECAKFKMSQFSKSCYDFYNDYIQNAYNNKQKTKLWTDWIVNEWTSVMVNIDKNQCQIVKELYKLQNENNKISNNLLESMIMTTMTNEIIKNQNKCKLLKETDISTFISTFLSIKSLSSIDNDEIMSVWHNLLPNYVHPIAKDIITSIIQSIDQRNDEKRNEKEVTLRILFEAVFDCDKQFCTKMAQFVLNINDNNTDKNVRNNIGKRIIGYLSKHCETNSKRHVLKSAIFGYDYLMQEIEAMIVENECNKISNEGNGVLSSFITMCYLPNGLTNTRNILSMIDIPSNAQNIDDEKTQPISKNIIELRRWTTEILLDKSKNCKNTKNKIIKEMSKKYKLESISNLKHINSEYYQLEIVIQILISMNKTKNNKKMNEIINELKLLLESNNTYKDTIEIKSESIKNCIKKLPNLLRTFNNLETIMNINNNNNTENIIEWLIENCSKNKRLPKDFKVFVDLLKNKMNDKNKEKSGVSLVNNKKFDKLLTFIADNSNNKIITKNVLKIIHDKSLTFDDLYQMTQELTGINSKYFDEIIKYDNNKMNQITKSELKQFVFKMTDINSDNVKTLLSQWFDGKKEFDLSIFENYLIKHKLFNESLLLKVANYIANKSKISIIDVSEMLLQYCLENNILDKKLINCIQIVLNNKKLKSPSNNNKIMLGKSIQYLLNICNNNVRTQM